MPEKLRVMHINPDMDLGGTQKHLAGTIPHLVKEGVEPIIVSTGGRLVGRVEEDGARHISAPVAGKAPWQIARASRALRKIFQECKPDLVRAHAVVPGIAARLAIRGLGGARPPLLVSMHRMWDAEFSGLGRLSLPFLYRALDRTGDHILTVCKPFKESLKAHGISEDKITVVENGIDASAADSAPPREQVRADWRLTDRDVVVGFLGRMVKQKLIGTLIDAAPMIVREEGDAVFVLVGDGPSRRGLERQVAGRDLGDRFRFLGFRTDVHNVLPGFDVFVLPSLWEGLPNALLEAMVHGKPCVVTAVTGNTEVVVDGQSGLLVPPRDAPAIAQAVVRLIREPDLARSIGRGAAQRVRERFSVERAVRATVELYRNLVGRAADGSRRGCGADVEVR